ncbi:hypothetical protein BSKO_04962 [Bryopsis sp. KO-2023]|nr:hypothetical protein BSKO_04962 [Bryopsis sp. KO-2023]
MRNGGGKATDDQVTTQKSLGAASPQAQNAPKVERRGAPKAKGLTGALMSELKWLKKVKSAKTYRPTKEEFEDPLAYIRKIEPEAAQKGICKIVPPPGFDREVGLSDEFTFSVRHQKLRDHNWEHFGQNDLLFEVEKVFTLSQYRENTMKIAQATLGMYSRAPEAIVEAEYWRQRTCENLKPMYVEYGNDLEGTAFCKGLEGKYTVGDTKWNLSMLGKARDSVLRHIHGDLPGITSPMLYIGALFATFYWHVEDHFMHSINYMHAGAPKVWYGVPAHGADGFEKVCLDKVYKSALDTKRAMGEQDANIRAAALSNLILKTTMFTPKPLIEANVPVYRAVQRPGEFIVTFPRSYHGGFSQGFNVGEAVNFALPEWFPIGRQAIERYGSLRTTHILPHEELLCREAISVGSHLEKFKTKPTKPQLVVIQEYVATIQKQREQRMELKGRGAKILEIDWPHGSNPCSRCNSLCFLGMVGGEDKPLPMCLTCALKDGSKGSRLAVYVRPTLARFETLAGRLWRHKLAMENDTYKNKSSNCKKSRQHQTDIDGPDPKRQKNSSSHKENVEIWDSMGYDELKAQFPLIKTEEKNGPTGNEHGSMDLDLDCIVSIAPLTSERKRDEKGNDNTMYDEGDATQSAETVNYNRKRRFSEFLNSQDKPFTVAAREKVDIYWKPFVRTVLHDPDNPEDRYLLAGELLDAAGIRTCPSPESVLSRILSLADELSLKLGTEPIEVEPLKAYYSTEDGAVKEDLVLGRGEVDALLMALLDKPFIRVAMFQNKVWPQSLWNVVVEN